MTESKEALLFIAYAALGVFAIYWLMHIIMVSCNMNSFNHHHKYVGRKLCPNDQLAKTSEIGTTTDDLKIDEITRI